MSEPMALEMMVKHRRKNHLVEKTIGVFHVVSQ